MKKYIIFAALIMGPVAALFAQGIEFNHGTWTEIKAQAKKENKQIFLDFYTVWCAPCKKMAIEVFPLPEAGAFYNKHFINVKVDAEKGEGIALAKEYRPSGYPTLVFTDADGKQLYRTMGAENAQELIKHAQVALNPQKDYDLLKERFAKNQLGKEDLYRFMIIAKAKDQTKEVNDIFDRYFSLVHQTSAGIFALMEDYVTSSKAKSFTYLQQHDKDFYRSAGKKPVDDYIKRILKEEFSSKFLYYDKKESKAHFLAAKAILKSKTNLTEKEALQLDVSFYQHINDEDNFMKSAGLLVKNYAWKNDEELSMILGGAYAVKQKAHLLELKKWAEMAVALKDNSLNYLGLAMINDQLSDKEAALKNIDLCMEASKRDDDGKISMIARFKEQIEKHHIQPPVQGIEFTHGKWEEIKAMAKAKHKLIFVDFYTDWCAPCKYMTMNIFPQKEAGDFYNQNFISYKVDAEKGEGPVLAKQYHVSGYPTLAYINADGEVVHRITSSTDVKELIEHGKMALTPRNDDAVLKEKFAKNELGKEELYRYFLIVKAKGDDKETNLVFDQYFKTVAGVNTQTFDLITGNVSSTDSAPFKYLETHVKEFSGLIGNKKVEGYIRKLYLEEFQGNVWYKTYKTRSEYEKARTLLNNKINLTAQEALTFDTDYELKMGTEDSYIAKAKELIEKYYNNDDLQISNIIGSGSRMVKTEKNLLVMKGWAERALAIKNNFINNATLAMLYKELKNKPMALKYIDLSIAQCKQEKNGYEDRAAMLKKEIEEAVY